MAKPVRRRAPTVLRAMFPDLPGWSESPRTSLLAFSSAQTFRVEELVRDGHYVIRAELPGLDPATDIEVTLDRMTLRIHAERRQQDEPYCTEFRYGSATRSVRLPAPVDPHHVTACYRNGILEITVPMPVAQDTRIPIQNADVPGSGQATEPAVGSAATAPTPGTSIASAPPLDPGSAQHRRARSAGSPASSEPKTGDTANPAC
jgi:HSP20 family protein